MCCSTASFLRDDGHPVPGAWPEAESAASALEPGGLPLLRRMGGAPLVAVAEARPFRQVQVAFLIGRYGLIKMHSHICAVSRSRSVFV